MLGASFFAVCKIFNKEAHLTKSMNYDVVIHDFTTVLTQCK